MPTEGGRPSEGTSAGDVAWVLMSTALVLLMTPGLAFFYGGLVRGQNVLNTMMMSIISMGVVAVGWFLYGFSLAFGTGGGGFIGDLKYAGLTGLKNEAWPGTNIPALLFVVFQMTFAIIGAAIISGAVVERMRFGAYVAFILIWSLLVYDVACHWVWGPDGWIDKMGAKDFAGGTVVHELTASSALALCALLGPRSDMRDKPQPHNVPFVILGAALLWFGWSGFNGGSALGANDVAVLALINSYLSASTGLVVWALLERLHVKRATPVGTVTGAIVGLVIITPAAGFVTPIGAVLMGLIGPALVYPSFHFSSARLDDSLDCFPCHGVSGFVGTVLTGLFAEKGGLFYGGGWRLVGVQVASAVAVGAYAMVMTTLIFLGLRLVMPMRVSDEEETFGLDCTVHGQDAYVMSDLPARDTVRDTPSWKSRKSGKSDEEPVNRSSFASLFINSAAKAQQSADVWCPKVDLEEAPAEPPPPEPSPSPAPPPTLPPSPTLPSLPPSSAPDLPFSSAPTLLLAPADAGDGKRPLGGGAEV